MPVAFHLTGESHNFTLQEVPEVQAGDLVFLGHPASPSGVLLNPELFLKVAAGVEAAGASFLLDEAFVVAWKDLVKYPPEPVSSPDDLSLVHQIFGIPGMRWVVCWEHRRNWWRGCRGAGTSS